LNSTLLLLAGIVLPIVFVSSLSVNSIYDFSRSQLEEICRLKNRDQRFGIILKHHEQALLAWALVYLIGLLFGLYCAVDLLGGFGDGPWQWSLQVLGRGFGLMTAFVLVAVILPWTIARVSGEHFLFIAWPATHVLLTILNHLLYNLF